MDWDLLFALSSAITLAGWLALVLLPRSERVRSAVLYAGVGLLCAIYLVVLFQPGERNGRSA